MVGMIFVRQIIHLSANFFGSTNLNHSTAELLISYKSVMDTLEELLLALLLQVGDVVLLVSWHLPVTVPVKSPFLEVVVKNGKGGPSCTSRISDSPDFLFVRSGRTCNRRCRHPNMISILRFGFRLEQFTQCDVPNIANHVF